MDIKLRTRKPNLTEVTVGDVTLYFSYETGVAFRAPGFGLVVSQNQWSTTTGKHLTDIDGGSIADRVPYEEFQRKLANALRQQSIEIAHEVVESWGPSAKAQSA